MEAANNQSRKRARDDEAAADNTEILQANKKECSNPVIDHDDQKHYEFHDGIGVFDFPWLKEGVVFEDKFAPSSYLDEAAEAYFAADCDQSSSPQNLSVSPPVDGDAGDDDSFLSLQVVDDLEPLDCIWSCVIDQPLLDVGSSKG
ncbi:uncharacterized protein LOC130985959 [Salvia miltiorrhiza]|uniref:uncharacterized protein LOC130985959 n=1 Tax=Salvia miltiorrhiza TaxID=226208 RepID=UPI0025ACA35A|nr:uncharacterized protein LOC130985959 [Salvia miltiorrhiza]